ncbi:MAG: hypothetical protein CL608_30065 [Anaerolineaceae bacterium]|nr:hypothetical protein [Anaerolineaceae bacterium]
MAPYVRFFARIFILWHIFAPKMKTRQQSNKPISLTKKYGSTAIGRRFWLITAITLAAATAIFLCLVGPVAEPDFWAAKNLVNLGANLILFTLVVSTTISPIGYIWHIFLSSVEAAVAVTEESVAPQLPPQLFSPWLSAIFSPHSLLGLMASVKNTAQSVEQTVCKRQPLLRSANKAPFGLFLQAVPLLAP